MLDIAIDNSTQKVAPIDDWPDPKPRAQRAGGNSRGRMTRAKTLLGPQGLQIHGGGRGRSEHDSHHGEARGQCAARRRRLRQMTHEPALSASERCGVMRTASRCTALAHLGGRFG